MKKVKDYIIITLVTLGAAMLYEKYVRHEKKINELNDQSLIQQYLLNDTSLDVIKKPILWIHVKHEKNARLWQNFNSRNSEYLNQPYIFLTIRSIIRHCGNSFQICLIDDDSFNVLLPDWNDDVNMLAEPIKNHTRSLALSKVLYKYGGFLVPNSFICTKNLISLYESSLRNKNMFVCENQPDSNVTQQTYYFPDMGFIGCIKESCIMNNFSDKVNTLVSNDFTNSMDFTGECNRILYEMVINNKIALVTGDKIGIKKTDNKPLMIEELMESSYIELPNNIFGVYIPSDKILKRRKYEWFANLSISQALSSNTLIGKFLLVSHEGMCSA